MDIGLWSDLCEKEKLSKHFYDMINACENNTLLSYTGKEIKDVIDTYRRFNCGDWGKDILIEDFWRDYINGIAFFPISDKVYYHLKLVKGGSVYPVRDIVKSPKHKTK